MLSRDLLCCEVSCTSRTMLYRITVGTSSWIEWKAESENSLCAQLSSARRRALDHGFRVSTSIFGKLSSV